MSGLNLVLNFAGQVDVPVRIGRMTSPDTLSVVSSAGYLDNYLKSESVALYVSDFIAVHASDGSQWYKPVFSTVLSGPRQGEQTVQLTVLP